MRAMVVPRWGEVSALREVAEPKAGPGEAVMKVRSAGVGLTLLNMRSGRFGGSTPRIMGHELSGDIVAVGDGVTNVKPGDRCAVYFYLTLRALPPMQRWSGNSLREIRGLRRGSLRRRFCRSSPATVWQLPPDACRS
jgi:NADPH:quinone reductase-like Zn-dependent oxidoreductase